LNNSLVEDLVLYINNILKKMRLACRKPTPLRNKIILLAEMLFRGKKRLAIKRLANISCMRLKTKRNNIIDLAEL
jgi:hypothetical protein